MKRLIFILALFVALRSNAQQAQAPIVFSNITQMQVYKGNYYFAALTDTVLGGLFTTVFGTYTPDNLNIIISGKANRYWRRINNNSTPPGSGIVVNSVAQLAVTPPDSRNVGQVLGFYTPNDGGGGFFWFDSTDNSTPVAGFIIQMGATSGRWKRIPTKGSLFDVRWFGAIGDGATDNKTILQNAVNYIGTYWKGSTLYFPGVDTSLSYIVNGRVLLRSFVNILGDGIGSKVHNISTSGTFGATFPFAWGNMEVPSFSSLRQFAADSIYQNRIKLHTASNADSFHVGDIITLSSLTGFAGAGGFFRPYVGEVSKVDSVNVGLGLVIMDDLIDTSLFGGNVGINGHFAGSQGAVDELGDSCRIIEYCNVSNMNFVSDNSWFGRTSMYKCNFSNIWSYGQNGWGGNCMSRCFFKNFNMQFWRRAQEMDLFAHDSRYEDFTATYVPGRAGDGDTNRLPQIRFGESCRNLYVKNYILNITGYYTGPPVEFNEGENNTIDGLTVYGNLGNQGAVVFRVAQDSAFVNNCKAINSSFFLDTTTTSYVTFDLSGNTHSKLQNNVSANNFFYGNLGGGKTAVSFDGNNNKVMGGFMNDTAATISNTPSSTTNCVITTTLLKHTTGIDGVNTIFGVLNDGNHNIIAPQSANLNGNTMQGTNNTAIGFKAADSLNSGGDNTGLGFNALASSRSGTNNTAVGSQALEFSDTAVSSNTAVGYRALKFVHTGSNTAVGSQALLNDSSGINTAMGFQTMLSNTTGSRNTAIGYQAGSNNTTGNDNIYLGQLSGDSNSAGSNNIFIGANSGNGLSAGANNIMVAKGSYPTHFNDSNTINIASNLFAVNTPNPNTTDSTTGGAARWGFGVRQPTAFVEIQNSTGAVGQIELDPAGTTVSPINRTDGLLWCTFGTLWFYTDGTLYQLNKPIQFTPANSTDATYPDGTITVDNTYLWYKNTLDHWTKIAWQPF